MYCSSCGVDSVEGLKYCKRCGVNLTSALEASPPRKMPVAMTIAFLVIIAGVFSVGLGLPMVVAHDRVAAGFSPSHLMDLYLADLALTLVVVGMLVWLFLRLIKLHQQTADPAHSAKAQPSDFAPPQIVEPPQSIGSVTENTTRNFDRQSYGTPRSPGDIGR